MAWTLGKATVDITADAKNLDKEFTGIGSRLRAFSTSIGGMLAGIGAGLLFKSIINESADAEESLNRFNAVFKESAEDTARWADQLADDVNRSSLEIKESASNFQGFFVGLGQTNKAAAKFSTLLTELSLDFASFNNVTDPEAANKMLSALSGSSEVVAKYGINLKAAALEQELLRMGLKDGMRTATEAAKVQARLNIIIRAMAGQDALGDAIGTSGSFTNQMKGMWAAVKDLKVALGDLKGGLGDVVGQFTQGIKSVTEWIKENPKLTTTIIAVTIALAGMLLLGPKIIGMIKGIGIAMKLLAANPIIIVLGLVALGVNELAKSFGGWGKVTKAVWAEVEPVWNVMKVVWNEVSSEIGSSLGDLWETFKDVFASIAEITGPFLKKAFKWTLNFIKEAFIVIGFTVTHFGDVWRWAWANVKSSFAIAGDFIWGGIKILGGAFVWVGKTIWNALKNAWEVIKNFGENIKNFAGAVWDWMKSGFSDWEFDWKPLDTGFKQTLADWPKWAKVTMSDTTKELMKETEAANTALAKSFVEYREEKLKDAEAFNEKEKKSAEDTAKTTADTVAAAMPSLLDSLPGTLAGKGKGKKSKKADFVGLADVWKRTQKDILNLKDPTTKAVEQGNVVAKKQLAVAQQQNTHLATIATKAGKSGAATFGSRKG